MFSIIFQDLFTMFATQSVLLKYNNVTVADKRTWAQIGFLFFFRGGGEGALSDLTEHQHTMRMYSETHGADSTQYTIAEQQLALAYFRTNNYVSYTRPSSQLRPNQLKNSDFAQN